MADEIIDGAPDGAAEVTDLRSTIRAAVESQRSSEPVSEALPEPAEIAEAAPAKQAKGDETEAERNERLRDDKGRFSAKDKTDEPGTPEKAAPAVKPFASDTPVAAAAPEQSELKPPPGWSPTAKVAFNNLPAEVQQAVVKREEEVNKGFAKLAEYKTIERYNDMAKQSGTTLDKALENYIGIENRLRQDFPAGIAELCRNQGIHPVALANQILARNGVAPPQPGAAGETPEVRQQAPSVDLSPVMQKISALETYITNQQTQGVQSELQRFASDPEHPFFENVKVQMGRLINSGQAEDLKDAYEQACWGNKEIRELLIKKQTPAASANAADAVSRAKAAAKATGGAPGAGFKANPGTAGASIRDTIRAAVDSQRGI